jgi:hypothetical protein
MDKGDNNMDYHEIPYIIVGNEVINEVSQMFVELTKYCREQFINKSLSELCDILRINSPSKLSSINKDYYIFTSSYEPVEVTISIQYEDSKDQRIYCFISRENAQIEDELSYVNQVIKDNKIGHAIHSAPDFILLKATKDI